MLERDALTLLAPDGASPEQTKPAGAQPAGGEEKSGGEPSNFAHYGAGSALRQDGREQDDQARAFFRVMLDAPASVPEAVDLAQFGRWQEYAATLLQGWALDHDPASVRQQFAVLAQNDAALSLLVAGDGDEDEEAGAAVADALVPDLPAAARLPDGLGRDVGEWLDAYVRYASEMSERTPEIVHEAAGLWLAAAAVARRLHVAPRHDDIWPNLYLLAVAPTTLYAKTTGLNVATRLLNDAFPHLALANESTPEALLAELAGKEPPNLESNELTDTDRQVWRLGQKFSGQRGLVLEEASALLAGLRRDYMQGMAELLLRLYDCPPSHRRHTRGGGFLVIRNAYLSIIGWTTPARLRTAEVETAWQDGLFARFALLTPEGQPRRPSEDEGPRPIRPSRLVEDLTRLANSLLPTPERYPEPVDSRAVAMAPEASKAWRRYFVALSHDLLTGREAPDQRLGGTYGRLPTMALKVALLLAALDWASHGGGGEPVITLGHYARAQWITERWRASAHRLLDQLSSRPEAEQEDSDRRRALLVLERANGRWLTHRELQRGMGSNKYSSAAVDTLVSILAKDGRVEIDERKREGPGRATSRCVRIVSKK